MEIGADEAEATQIAYSGKIVLFRGRQKSALLISAGGVALIVAALFRFPTTFSVGLMIGGLVELGTGLVYFANCRKQIRLARQNLV